MTHMTLFKNDHEHAANVMHDVASALDAGLGADAIAQAAGCPDATDPAMIDVLSARGVQLTAMEEALLTATAQSGTTVEGLRRLAKAREHAAARKRQLLFRVAYPVFLLVAVIALSIFLLTLGVDSTLTRITLACGIAVPLVALGVGMWLVRSGFRDPDALAMRIPWLATLFWDAAEIPYLESFSALHGAGVTTREAHSRALTTVPVAHVKERLLGSSSALEDGTGYVDALRSQPALRLETLALLTPAERSGNLEEGSQRAAIRCRERLDRGLDRAIRVASGALYGFAVLLVVMTVFGFYSNYFGMLNR